MKRLHAGRRRWELSLCVGLDVGEEEVGAVSLCERLDVGEEEVVAVSLRGAGCG